MSMPQTLGFVLRIKHRLRGKPTDSREIPSLAPDPIDKPADGLSATVGLPAAGNRR